jgi:hypothetical protein
MNRGAFTFDLKCRARKAFRAAQRFSTRSAQNRFLFILCPPYAGSTLMHEIICTSAQVSPTNIFGVREGQGLPEVRRLVDYRKEWDEDYEYPWCDIKSIWLQYWDTSRPVLMDKSPPNLLRARDIQRYFHPCSFIVMTRNPYAQSEGMMRRNKMPPKSAAEFAVKCLRFQRQNAESLDRSCTIRYEDLVTDPLATKRQLETFMPQLKALDMDRRFTAHNRQNEKLRVTDLNPGSIARLTNNEKAQLTDVFAVDPALLSGFGYDLL